MSRLLEIKAKYSLGDGAKYEPNPECKRCGGTGERTIKRQLDVITSPYGDITFCHCLFIEPTVSNEIDQMFSDFAKKMREEMDG